MPSLDTCSRTLSMVMKVPVRPTPALEDKQKVKHNIKTWTNKVIDYISCNIWYESAM